MQIFSKQRQELQDAMADQQRGVTGALTKRVEQQQRLFAQIQPAAFEAHSTTLSTKHILLD